MRILILSIWHKPVPEGERPAKPIAWFLPRHHQGQLERMLLVLQKDIARKRHNLDQSLAAGLPMSGCSMSMHNSNGELMIADRVRGGAE